MVIGSYLTGVASGLTVEAIKALGIRWKGDATPFKDKPHWRLGQRPSIGRAVLGRKELTELVATTMGNRRSVAIVKGMGGVGKTTVARYYVETHGARYHGVLWVQAETETTLINDLTLLARAVEVPGIDRIVDAGARAQACLDAVSASGQDWLIVFDNAPDAAALTRWSIEGARVRVLITSRATDWSPEYRRITADVLPTDTAEGAGPQLLIAETKIRDDPEGARALAAELGGLPLALVAAGGLIRDIGGGFARYLHAYQTVLTTEVASYHAPDGLERSVIGAVKLSYDALERDARMVLDLFAWCAPEGLDGALLTDVPNSPNVARLPYSLRGEIMALCSDPDRVDAALLALVRRSLLERNGESYSLHRMSAAALRAMQKLAGRQGDVVRQAAAVLAAQFPRRPDLTENWPACARLTPHVLALHWAWAPDDCNSLTSAIAEHIFNQGAIYLLRMSEFDPALALAMAAHGLTLKRLPESCLDVAISWSTMGEAYMNTGWLEEAVDATQECVRLCKVHNHGPEYLARAHNTHAATLRALAWKLGDRAFLEQALTAGKAAVEVARVAFGAKSAEVAEARGNLAVDHAACGDVPLALEMSTEPLEVLRSTLPQGDSKLGFALNNTGSYHLQLGQAGHAYPLLKEALVLRRTVYSCDDDENVQITAGWLVRCHLVLARRDPLQHAAAWQVAKTFGLNWEKEQREAAKIIGPVD